MNEPTVQRSRRISYAFGAAMLFLAAIPGQAANLVDVRIGVHKDYTRVVLETDAKASHRIESSGSEELVLQLGAGAGARLVASQKSAQLVSVTVKPVAAGASQVRIALRGPVDVKEMVLSGPPRIVLDLRAATAESETMPTALQPAAPTPRAKPLAEPAPEPTKEPSPPAPSPQRLAKVPPAETPAQPVKPAAEEAGAPDTEEAAAAPSLPEPDPGAALAAREAPKKPAPAAREPSTLPRRIVTPPPPAKGGGLLDALPAPLDEPLVVGGIAAFLILVIALLVLRRRGAAARDDVPITPFAVGEPFSIDGQPEAAEESRAEEEDADLPIRPGEAAATDGPSLFDQPVEAVQPVGEGRSDAAAMEEESVAPPPTAGPAPVAGLSPEIERRLAKAEERLEEVVEAKERLERQVAAQTEELRVQRAAIARTQRVLRNLTRPEEEATEPVPKT